MRRYSQHKSTVDIQETTFEDKGASEEAKITATMGVGRGGIHCTGRAELVGE